MGRLILAAIVGGILEFAWGAFSHLVLGITHEAFERMPNEEAVLEEVKDTPPGTYGFPWVDQKNATDADWQAREEKGRQTAIGILVRWPADALSMEPQPKPMALELLSNFLGALILAIVGAGRGFAGRVGLGTALGLFAFLSQNASYWIWYHFSTALTTGELIDAVVGWTIAGIGVALVMGRKRAA